MRLVFATRNPDKLIELQQALTGLPIEIRSAIDYPEIPPVEETGATLRENALLKAQAVHRSVAAIALADDTGLEVDALDGAPGVRSGRFAGSDQDYSRNLDKLLRLLEGVPAQRRTARFRTVVAILFPDGHSEFVEGTCAGEILLARRGTGGFGYDPVFLVPECGQTFAEMTLEEKNRISHRGQAMKAARAVLEAYLASGPAHPGSS